MTVNTPLRQELATDCVFEGKAFLNRIFVREAACS